MMSIDVPSSVGAPPLDTQKYVNSTNLASYTYPIVIFDVDSGFSANKVFYYGFTSFCSCNIQGSPLTERKKLIVNVT